MAEEIQCERPKFLDGKCFFEDTVEEKILYGKAILHRKVLCRKKEMVQRNYRKIVKNGGSQDPP